MPETQDSDLQELLNEAAAKERQALKRATLYTAIPVLIGLLLVAISTFQIIRLENNKRALSAEVNELKISQESLKKERDLLSKDLEELQNRKTSASGELKELLAALENTRQRVQEAEKALAESTAALQNISEGKGDATQQAQITLQQLEKAAPVGRWVVIGADKTLDAAQFEVKQARKLGFPNTAIYLRDQLYRTVIEFPDEATAKAELAKLRKRYNGAYLRDLAKWCPNSQKRGDFFQCPN